MAEVHITTAGDASASQAQPPGQTPSGTPEEGQPPDGKTKALRKRGRNWRRFSSNSRNWLRKLQKQMVKASRLRTASLRRKCLRKIRRKPPEKQMSDQRLKNLEDKLARQAMSHAQESSESLVEIAMSAIDIPWARLLMNRKRTI